MRWTGFLLAVACTHAQPPPAPLAVPAENAAGPANLPDAGAPDAGAPDGGADGGAPRADLVSPITAAGTEVPVELDWADKGEQPASTLFKNVKVLGAVSGGDEKPPKMAFSKELPEFFARMPPEQLSKKAEAAFKDVQKLQGMDVRNFGLIMAWFAREMGGKCTHCHDAKDFAATMPKKTRAREMLAMTSYVADGYFGGNSPVGCDTCHRGSPEPPRTPGDKSVTSD